MASVPRELLKLPQFLREAIIAQCGGDFRRVTLDDGGGFTVHNKPQENGLKLRTAPAKKNAAAKRVGPKGPRPAPPKVELRRVEVAPRRLAEPLPMFKPPPIPEPAAAPTRGETPPEPPPAPVKVPRPARGVFNRPPPVKPEYDDEVQWTLLPGREDWDPGSLAENAWRICQQVSAGIGDDMPLLFHDDVTALNGLDLGQVESVVRHAQRVEVDASTGWKKYPILKFHRGDDMVVVGFRERIPKIMAAYLLCTSGARGNGSGVKTGGGGARKKSGLPKNPREMILALRGLGAEVPDPDLRDKVVAVTFKGYDLGKVRVEEGTQRRDIESDYQRTHRRIYALLEREKAGKS